MKNNKKLSILLAVVLLSLCNSVSAEKIAEKYNSQTQVQADENIKANKATFEKAIELMNNKDFDKAVIYLTGYINSKSKKFEAYKLRGDCYYALRQYELAKQDYQAAIDLKTSDDKFLTGTKYVSAVILGADKQEQLQNPELGNLYGRLMYAQKALNDYNYETSYSKAVQYNSHIYLPQPKKEEIALINCPQKYGKVVNPKGIDETIYGAIDDIQNEKYTDVIFKSQKIISEYPNYYLGYYLYGVGLNGLEKDEDAIVAFQKAIELNPYDFESMASLGNIYFDKAQITFNQDDARKSVRYFNQALKYNENCYLYHFYIAMNELLLNNNEVAISEFNKAIKLKPNDYNSLYYKSIAQYLKSDYNNVIDGATKLLYKHVSNYNSVLYLRALAQYKLKNYEMSNSDLDTILGNFGDIYNADIRIISSKEQTLENYVYYLKALNAQSQGDGAKSDLAIAYKNPIIAHLDKARMALKPYEKNLQGDTISFEDYNKFNDFYESGFSKLLQSNVVITESDIDNQYDYIRTTFDDMGLSFVYENSNYKLSIIKDYPYKKYSSKISKDKIAEVEAKASEEVKQEVAQNESLKPELKAQASDDELLLSKEENSLAKVLATNSYGLLGPVIPEDKAEISQEKLEKESSLSVENSDNVKKIVQEERVIDEFFNDSKKESESFVAQEQNLDESKIENVEKNIPKVVKVQKEPGKINEKHANINHEELGLNRPLEPEISEKDEIIVLDKPEPILYSEEDKEKSEELLANNILNNKKGDFESFEKETQKIVSQSETSLQQVISGVSNEQYADNVDIPVEMPEVTLPQEMAKSEDLSVEVPVVNVPELNNIAQKPKVGIKEEVKDAAGEIEKTEDKSISQIALEEKVDIDLRPKAVIEEEQIPSKEDLAEQKKQAKLQAKALKEQQKQEKAKAKAEEKLKKQQEKAQALADKEKAKAEAAAQKEQEKIEKAAQKASEALKKEELRVQKAKEKEMSKLEKMQEVVEKALDEKFNIEEHEKPASDKKTIIKKLEQ